MHYPDVSAKRTVSYFGSEDHYQCEPKLSTIEVSSSYGHNSPDSIIEKQAGIFLGSIGVVGRPFQHSWRGD
jgi:hypothetical protein